MLSARQTQVVACLPFLLEKRADWSDGRPLPSTPLAAEAPAAGGSTLGNVADAVGHWIPGVAPVLYGRDAFNDFRQGRIWSGLGNTLGGALSLIPGMGGVGKILQGGKNLATGAKFLNAGREFSPLVSKTFGALNRIPHGLGSAIMPVEGALAKGTTAVMHNLVPGGSKFVNWGSKNLGRAGAMDIGGQFLGQRWQGRADQAAAAKAEAAGRPNMGLSALASLRASGFGMPADPRSIMPHMSTPSIPTYSPG